MAPINTPNIPPKIAPDQGLEVAPQQGPSVLARLPQKPIAQPNPAPMAAPMMRLTPIFPPLLFILYSFWGGVLKNGDLLL